jgi:sulfate permease, SulP family
LKPPHGDPEPGDAASGDSAAAAYDNESPFARSEQRPLLSRTVPVSDELPGYRPNTARRDGVAALTVAALALPSAMAYAEVAGVSPVNGLYALLLPTVAYALLGTSRQLVIGPEGSISALVGASVLGLAAAGSAAAARLAAMLALLVAACFALAWLLRLGWIADYLSRPVLIGYIRGVAAVLVIGQLDKVLGLDIEAMDPVPQLVELGRELGDTSATTLAVAAGALLVLLPLRFVAPRFPAPLVAVVGGIALSYPVGARAARRRGRGRHSVRPAIPRPAEGAGRRHVRAAPRSARALPGHVRRRDPDGPLIRGKARPARPSGAGAAGDRRCERRGGLEPGHPGRRKRLAHGRQRRCRGTHPARSADGCRRDPRDPDLPDRPDRRPAEGRARRHHHLRRDRPGESGEMAALRATDHVEVAIAAVTMAGVLVAGVLEATAFAVGLSIVDVVRRSARPHDAVLGWVERLDRYADVSVHRDARLTPGVVVYRLDDRLFFANASYVKGRVLEALRGAPTRARWLVFDAEAMTHVDSAGLAAIDELVRDLRRDGITIVVARMRSAIRQQLDEVGLSEQLGLDHFCPTVRAAVAACERAQSPQNP